MKKILLASVMALFAQNAAAEIVYKCIDGTRSMTVYKDVYGNLRGINKGFANTRTGYALTHSSCTRMRPGNTHAFRCVSTDKVYEYIVARGASGQMTTWVNLNGGDDNGLHTLTCGSN